VAEVRVEVCPNEGRAMRSSPLRRQAQRFGSRYSQPPIKFPCSAPLRDGKSPHEIRKCGGCRFNWWQIVHRYKSPCMTFAV
jgi:hypothetical protein